MKLLIVDDEPAILDLLGELAEPLGYEPVLTRDGAEAWEAFDREPFRAVITDWLMPRVDGLELTRRIRARKRVRYTYVIMLTALGGSTRYLEGMKAGADDFVTKPVTPEELHARLRVAERILRLQDDVKLLEGLVRICMYCKNIHLAGDDWTSIERYVEERSDASFTHDICPGCYTARVGPDLQGFVRQAQEIGPGDGPSGDMMRGPVSEPKRATHPARNHSGSGPCDKVTQAHHRKSRRKQGTIDRPSPGPSFACCLAAARA